MRRLTVLPADEVAELLQALDDGDQTAMRPLTKHFLACLAEQHPGRSVEVRIPPYAAVQCIEGARHTRGTPPAVVEMDAAVWIKLARGHIDWQSAPVRASGERSDLSAYLPLI